MEKLLRTLAVLVIASMIAVPLAAPRPVYAFDIVKDPFNFIVNTASKISTHATAVATGSLATKEYVLDSLAYTVKTVAIQAITKSVVNWINSGFQGSPAFVTNIDQSLLRVGDTYANSFLDQLTSNSSIRSPFQSQVAQSVRANYFLSTGNDGFFQNNSYTLNKVVKNDSAFLRGDFTQGGWSGFLSASQPSNNPFGAQLLGQDQLQSVVGNAVENQKTEWQWSSGVSSFRGTNCPITRGNTRVSVTNLGGAAKSVALSTVNNCLFNAIQTSGSVISHAMNTYLVDNGLNQYISADEVNEVVGALMGQLVNKVLGNGGIFGLSQPSSGGGRSYIDQAADPSQNSASASPASGSSQSAQFLTMLGNQLQVIQAYQSNWQTINGVAVSAQKALAGCGMSTSAADTVVTQSAAALSNASIALSSLDKIKNEFIAAAASSAVQTAALNAAQTDYTAFLAASSTPQGSDIDFANAQSQDTGDQTPASLYTQMMQLQATAICAAPH